ncbi:MAG: hypothetical protein KBE09_03290 [Candidatus Pacebacteria bacterium]|nr:hypothetical protein [Candidatus Paceibacterota bacterium]
MLTRYEHEGIVWIDLESPRREEVRDVMEEFDIDALIAEELLLPTTKPRVDARLDYCYLILHFPALRHSHKSREQEVDFIIGKKYIITTRYDTIDPLHKFSKIFEVNSVLDRQVMSEHAGYIFFYMLKRLYGAVEHEISYIGDALLDIEGQIFEGHEREMVEGISRSGRDLLNLRHAIEPHRDVLKEFETVAPKLFGDSFKPYVIGIINDYYKVHNHVMRHIASLQELRETNNSLLNTKQNEIMKTLTLLAFVTYPLALIAAVFGMNTAHTPLVGGPYGFWLILILMFTAAGSMFFYFKYRKWL